MLIRNKREILARAMQGLGVVRLLERFARRPGLLVVTYHRIGSPASNPFYDPVFSATPEAFRAQVRHLRDRFRLLSLDELLAAAESGFRFAGPSVLITFDDGYRDNAEFALPILTELGAPATFFLVPGLLNRPRLPWWDHIAYVMKRTSRPRLELEYPAPLAIDLGRTSRPGATWAVIRTYIDAKELDPARFFSHLSNRAEVPVDSEALASSLFLTWDQARHLADAGMAIGSHSHNHPHLARLPEADQRRELIDSKHALESQLGRPVTALAYPYGEGEAFNATTKRLAQEAGYRLAFSARRGINPPGTTDPYELGRIGIGSGDSPTLVRARTVSYLTFGSSIF